MLQNVTGNFLASIRHFWSSLHTEDLGPSRKYDFVGRRKDSKMWMKIVDCFQNSLVYIIIIMLKKPELQMMPSFVLCSAPDQSIFILGSEKWAISC